MNHWPPFSMDGESKDRERWGRRQPVSEQSEHRQLLSSSFLYGRGPQHPQNNHNSSMRGHGSHTTMTNTVIMKKCGMLPALRKVIQGHDESRCCWTNGSNGPARCRVATNLPFVRSAPSAKCDEAEREKRRRARGCIPCSLLL